jgi:hypothetical protein
VAWSAECFDDPFEETPARKRAKSLTIRKLIFRNHALDIVRLAPDPISKSSICLNRHALNDRVDHRRVSFSAALRPLTLVLNVVVQLVAM